MQLHKSIGIVILLLTLARLGWRLARRPPPSVEGGWEGMLAKAVHFAFYAVLLLGPLTGWAIVSGAEMSVPTRLFGVVPWPHLPIAAGTGEDYEDIHSWLGWIALGLFVLHVAGALRHQFLLRDPVIRRMAPRGSVPAAMVLLVATVALYFGSGSYVAKNFPRGPRPPRPEAGTPAGPATLVTHGAPGAAAGAATLPTPVPTPEETPTPSPTAAAGPPPVWTISGGKRLAFTVDNGGSPLRGTFSDWSGAIKFDPDHPENADLSITVGLASASLGDATQDDMLQGPDFFASGANPRATWRSTNVTQTGPGRYRAAGTLSLRGASRPQTVNFTLTGSGLKRRVAGTAAIDRSAFGIGEGEAGEGLGKTVSLTFAFDAVGRAG
jgi:cytochrome b561/polyisoprenoid-binding protein YceI